MDVLHVKSAVKVRCDWCVPHNDVALYWVCAYSESNNASVTKQGHLELRGTFEILKCGIGVERRIYNDI